MQQQQFDDSHLLENSYFPGTSQRLDQYAPIAAAKSNLPTTPELSEVVFKSESSPAISKEAQLLKTEAITLKQNFWYQYALSSRGCKLHDSVANVERVSKLLNISPARLSNSEISAARDDINELSKNATGVIFSQFAKTAALQAAIPTLLLMRFSPRLALMAGVVTAGISFAFQVVRCFDTAATNRELEAAQTLSTVKKQISTEVKDLNEIIYEQSRIYDRKPITETRLNIDKKLLFAADCLMAAEQIVAISAKKLSFWQKIYSSNLTNCEQLDLVQDERFSLQDLLRKSAPSSAVANSNYAETIPMTSLEFVASARATLDEILKQQNA